MPPRLIFTTEVSSGTSRCRSRQLTSSATPASDGGERSWSKERLRARRSGNGWPVVGSRSTYAETEDRQRSRLLAADRGQIDLAEIGGRESCAVAEQQGQDVHQDLVDEPLPEALTGQV